jgi:putative addiction module killer protein
VPPAVEILDYVNAKGRNPFREWLRNLDLTARDTIERRLVRLAAGNPGDIEPVGEGVSELRIHSGPGYRVYVALDGRKLVILLGGGTKRTQNRDIVAAKAAWTDYRTRKVKR